MADAPCRDSSRQAATSSGTVPRRPNDAQPAISSKRTKSATAGCLEFAVANWPSNVVLIVAVEFRAGAAGDMFLLVDEREPRRSAN
jgi:hypothetical protein